MNLCMPSSPLSLGPCGVFEVVSILNIDYALNILLLMEPDINNSCVFGRTEGDADGGEVKGQQIR